MANSNQVDTGSAVNNYDGAQVATLDQSFSFAPYEFDVSKSFEMAKTRGEYEWSVANPCDPGTVSEIDTALRNFFNFLKGLKGDGSESSNETLGEAQNTVHEISKTVSKISAVLRTFTQRLRTFIIGLITEVIQGAINCLLTPLLEQIKDTFLGVILDQLMCKFDEIMNGLKDLVSDFLLAFINLSIVNPALCAIESLVNGLLNNLADTIDNEIQPILSQIGDLLGGAAEFVGSVFSAIDTVLGYEGLLCSQPKCPENVAAFKTGPWANLKESTQTDFSGFKPSEGIAGFNEGVDKWLNEVFPADSNESGSSCYTGSYECGSPQIVFFGGGGSGASANAIVNGIGQIIGVNLLNGGSGYTSRPFVSIADPAGCGFNAAAYATIEDGKVKEVVLTNPGHDYKTKNLGGVPIINSFVGTPNPVQVGGSITLSWDVSNFTRLSLGMSKYNNITNSTGSVNLTIKPEDVQFAAGANYTTKKYTLTATKENQNSAPQIVKRDFVFTVTKLPVTGETPTPTPTTGPTPTPTTGPTPTPTTGPTPTPTVGPTPTPTPTPTITPPISPSDSAIAELDKIRVLTGGIDYSPDDEVNIVGGNNGATLELVTTPIGQITGIKVITPGYGFTSIPEIEINSKNGVGASFLASLKFVPLDQFLSEQQIQSVDPTKLVQVIDCVYK